MAREFMAIGGLLAAIAFACPSTEAGDRKSATTGTQERAEIAVRHANHLLLTTYESNTSAATHLLQRTYPASTVRRLVGESDRDDSDRRARDRKPLTLFHLHSSMGEIAVEPVLGHVNGARLSIQF